ncbi:MAG TPA: MogA/MoaB family molybdenum cofactor biosynthesis protein, partial [Acidimicrobiia bacterium]
MTLAAKVLTVSDGVAGGTRDDASGRALVERLAAGGYEVIAHRVTRDGADAVAEALVDLAEGFAGLIVTTGGTGFGPRDLTPEGTRAVIERDAPGIVEAIRRASDAGDRGFGMLSRAVSGTRGRSLICNLP